MPTTVQLYDHTLLRFAQGHNVNGDTYKVMLLNNDATFDATDTTLAEVAGTLTNGVRDHEVSGIGWDNGGEVLSNAGSVINSPAGAKFDADNLSVLITGGDLGPIYKFVLFNDTDADDPPLLFCTHSVPITVPNGNNAGVIWPSIGIIVWGLYE
jgi:hypothetical protein